MRIAFILLFTYFSFNAAAQNIAQKINAAVNTFLNNEQLKHAIVSLYVTDENGTKVYALNEEYGLAPASTQKIFTSIAALSLLGRDFTYKTEIGYTGNISNGNLNGDLIIKGYGDPTFGSWRYSNTKPASVLNFIVGSIKKAGINNINGNVILDDGAFSYQPLPGGYIWDDTGNYYGSGSWAINWRENQYDLILKPGKNIGDTSTIIKTSPAINVKAYSNFITTAQPNSGDNTILYLPPYSDNAFAEGTIPAGVKDFTVSGALPYAAGQLTTELDSSFQKNKMPIKGSIISGDSFVKQYKTIPHAENIIATYSSPTLDSIVYWFLQKSINLYGECLLKTIAYQEHNYGSTDFGVADLKKFWQQNGIDSSSVNISDGSGLSPQNRVTTHALVSALLYAKKQSWFQSFYNALPLYNNMKLKSGTISACRAFAGYHTASDGKKYVMAIIVNNYDAGKGNVTPKIFKVLDALK
ncbi:D-alanyl-D-alanine carboxypeptidase/D-alanyl-D-alanine-endopeptidase [Parafilimonas sp.]|uniref:D-alanyl-D-alanine carboxypeptidase/D-alanyl-D-alanine endopeptidase n=1 Tax=Parafilimonas sp. TaxID=1969739 RepID=UPI0039E27F83